MNDALKKPVTLPPLGEGQGMRGLGALLLLILSVFYVGAIHADVELPAGQYFETTDDLQVKVLGGHVKVARTWYDKAWHINRAWNPLKLTYDSLDGSLKSIERNGDVYKKTNAEGTLFRFDARLTITATAQGFRWADRNGNWITYNQDGQITAYGDRTNVQVSMVYNTSGQLAAIQDHLGRPVLTYSYDPQGRLIAVSDPPGTPNARSVHYEYSGERLSAVIDVLGQRTTYTYDSSGRLATATDPLGRTRSVSYHANGTVQRLQDPDGGATDYGYDFDTVKKQYYIQVRSPGGRLEETWYNREGLLIRQDLNGHTLQTVTVDSSARTRTLTDRNGGTTVHRYDELNNLVHTAYPDGSGVSYQYETTYSNITRQVDELGVITKHDYNTQGQLLRSTEAVGQPEARVTEYTYDPYGQRTHITRVGDNATPEATTAYTYDDRGNLTSESDPEGHTTHYTHDIQGNVLTRQDPLGRLWTHTYDAKGQLLSETNPLGHTTAYEYDQVGNKIKETDPAGNVTTYAYDARNNLVKITDALGHSKHFSYSVDNQLLQETDEEGKAKTYEYDAAGRLATLTDGNGNVTRLAYADEGLPGSGSFTQPILIQYPTYQETRKYDKRDRLLIQSIPMGSETLISRRDYDAKGNLTHETDRNGKITRYAYDAHQRLTRTTDTLGGITESVYDNRDNLVSLKDPNGNTTHFEYDKNNRPIKETKPLGQRTTYAYDATGNLTQKTDAKGQKTIYTYDEAHRQTSVQYFAAAATNPAQTITYTYDATGNLTAWNDGTISATLTYDILNRKLKETVNYGPFTLSHSYAYTANGQKKSLTTPDGTAYDYSYDANNQLSQIKLPGQGTITVNAYQWTAPTKVTLPGGSNQNYSYDNLLRTQSITVKDPAQNPLLSRQYSYDKAGNVLDKQTEHGTYSYSYDDLYRLTKADNPGTTDEQYGYDALGNRLTDIQVAGLWSYNANNQLLGYGDITYQYDANGNTIKRIEDNQSIGYLYDTRDRLVKVEKDNAPLATYYYDPLGRRLWKEVNGAKTYFAYADEGLIGEYDASGSVLKTYGYRPNSVWMTDPLFTKIGDKYYFYQNDQLGTPQKLTGVSGEQVWDARYDAFGQAQLDTAAIENNLRFPGQYFDKESGLHQNFHRDYDLTTGRYITSDPIGIKGGINLYLYVKANPLKLSDPLGLETPSISNLNAPGRNPHADIAICEYYDKQCKKYGCRYYCYAAPVICRTANINPLFTRDPTATPTNLQCVRKCLTKEDEKIHEDKKAKCEDGCLTDQEIDTYHDKCFTQCGVNPAIYPGVGILN